MENIKVNYINNPFELPANKNRRSFSVTPDLIDTYIEIIEKCDNSKKTYSYIENENILNVDSDRTITISQDDINSYIQKQDLITLLTNIKDVKNDDENVVSVYTIYKIIENLSKNIELKKNDFENQLKERLNFSKTIYINYEYEKIKICFSSNFGTKYYVFSENFGDVFVDSEDYNDDYDGSSYTTYPRKILGCCYDILEELFKFYKDIVIYMTETKSLKSIDDKFDVYVSFNSLVVSKSTIQCRQNNTFEIRIEDLKTFGIDNNKNNIQRTITNLSNSSKILALTKGNEVNILKNVYVKINECPTWLQNGLIQARDKELYKKFEVNSTEDLSMKKKGIFKKVKKLLKGEENE